MDSFPRVIFMGSPDFAVPSLRSLYGSMGVQAVVTQPDRPAGRGRALSPPPVKVEALSLGIPVIQPEKLSHPDAVGQLHSWSPDVIVVVAFGQILKPEVLDLPKYGCLNVHGSLLPRWRGAAPIQAAILAGDTRSGITIMKMDPGVDTGPILRQRPIPISPDDTGGSLFSKLASLGAELLIETLPDYLAGKILPQAQDERLASYAPLLKKGDGLLDFHRPVEELLRVVRAFNPWPGAYLLWEGQSLKIHRARPGSRQGTPGERLVLAGMPALAAADGVLILEEVQPAGKKPMPGSSFLAGARNWV